MQALSPETELTLLIGLSKPLAIEPENYEEFFGIIAPFASQGVMNAIAALRERFAKAFETPVPSREEKERRLRVIAEDMLTSPDRDARIAGSTLRGAVNRIYGRRRA
jgi:hypothetical protein